MAFPNPFEEFAQQLDAIRQTNLEILSRLQSTPHLNNSDDELVETKEAAKIIRLSLSRFHAIHKQYFPKRGQGHKRLFSRKELNYYNQGLLAPIVSVSNSERTRITRLSKKSELRIS